MVYQASWRTKLNMRAKPEAIPRNSLRMLKKKSPCRTISDHKSSVPTDSRTSTRSTLQRKQSVLENNVSETERKTMWLAATEGGDATFLSSHRREDLEDIFRSVSRKGAPQIFEISNEGYEFKQNSVNYHFSVHGPFVRLVAVDAQSGDCFRIS